MSLQVAKTIRAQLGGNRFSSMTGAKNFMGSSEESFLSFKLPSRFAKAGINYVKITLNASDLYDLEFGKTSRKADPELKKLGVKVMLDVYKIIDEKSMVHAEDLRGIFEDVTGLYTQL